MFWYKVLWDTCQWKYTFCFPDTWGGRKRDAHCGLLHRQELHRGKNTYDVCWGNRRYLNLAWFESCECEQQWVETLTFIPSGHRVESKSLISNSCLNYILCSFLLWSGCENPKPCQTELLVLEYGLYDGDPVTKVLLQPLTGNCICFKGQMKIFFLQRKAQLPCKDGSAWPDFFVCVCLFGFF